LRVKSQPALRRWQTHSRQRRRQRRHAQTRVLHTGSVVVPPALALAQTGRLSGRDLILALVAAMKWRCGWNGGDAHALSLLALHRNQRHFGAAATAAKALKLDVDVCIAAGARRHAGGRAEYVLRIGRYDQEHPSRESGVQRHASAQLAQLGATARLLSSSIPRVISTRTPRSLSRKSLWTAWARPGRYCRKVSSIFPPFSSHSPIQARGIVQKHAIDPSRSHASPTRPTIR